MKIITFQGGLGNQLFEYAFYCHLKRKFPTESFYSFFPNAALNNHNGLEINKRFDIVLPQESVYSNILGYTLFYLNKILSRLKLPLLLTSSDNCINEKALFFSGYWQDKEYLINKVGIKFKLECICESNKALVRQMQSENSVCIHIRRGDYLIKEVDKKNYGNICTEFYYAKAIEYIENHVENPVFYFFSDDSEYVRSHYKGKNIQIIDWNKGEDSFYDMYLMSCCKYMVLANSTFSYWAAVLNESVNLVLCPNRWNNLPSPPDIILDNWKIIES